MCATSKIPWSLARRKLPQICSALWAVLKYVPPTRDGFENSLIFVYCGGFVSAW